ncbi:MAG: DUF192 domain-containing protein [Thainema sp.]
MLKFSRFKFVNESRVVSLVPVFLSMGLSVLLLGCAEQPSSTSAADLSAEEPNGPSETVTSSSEGGQMLPITAEADMNGKIIQLEVAETQQQQAMGFMFRSEIPDNRGMLFPFDPPRRVSFWMKNVRVPLDMVFLRDGEVVAIASNVSPCTSDPCPTYGPPEVIDSVIELRGGRAAELGLQAGDAIAVEFLE